MARRAHTRTPPKPASDILANAKNSSARPGGWGGLGPERSGSGTVAGWESGGMVKSRTAFPRRQSPGRRPSWSEKRGFPALFFSTFDPYIEAAGLPAMEINGRRNKPFGPGGGTRRLHPSPSLQATLRGGLRRGRNRIDEGVK